MTPIRRIALVFLILLGGCRSFDYTSVHIDIGEIKLVNAEAGGTDAIFTLNITNETMFPIVIEEETHKISLNGSVIGSGKNEDSYGLPNMKVTVREVRVHLNGAGDEQRVRDAIAHGGSFKIETQLLTNSAGDHDKMSTTSTGMLAFGSN